LTNSLADVLQRANKTGGSSDNEETVNDLEKPESTEELEFDITAESQYR
jgi:hypothetical protein